MNTKTRSGDELLWSETKRELIAPCRIFDVNRVERQAPDGRIGRFFFLDAPDWVTVIPFSGSLEDLTALRGDFLMVEQFRHGINAVTVEFPAGTVEKGEAPKAAALRELSEETGIKPERLEPLGSVCPNPAFMNNRVSFFLALGLNRVGDQELDEHEEITLHYQKAAEVVRHMGSGRYNNGIMLIALAYLRQWLDR